MKQILKISSFSLVVTLLLSSPWYSSFSKQQSGAHKTDYVVLTTRSNQKSVSLLLSQTLLIVLPAQMSTGYTWKVVDKGEALGTIEKLDSTEIQKLTTNGVLEASQKGLPGVSEKQVFRLKPSSKGTMQIELYYEHSWEPDKPDKKFVVTLRVAN